MGERVGVGNASGPRRMDRRGERGGPSGSKCRRRLCLTGMTGLLLASLVYGLSITAVLGGAKPAGDPAPEVSLNTTNGEFRLSQQKGKVVILYFSFPG